MILSLNSFATKYVKLSIVPFFITSLVLTSSLIRNVINITLPEMIAGLGAITISISWCMMRDGPGYWLYSAATLRFKTTREDEDKVRRNHHLSTAWRQALFSRPLGASCVSLLVVAVLCLLVWPIGPSWRYWLIALLGGIALPIWLNCQLERSIPYHLYQVFHLLTDKPVEKTSRSWYGVMCSDLLLSLLVNFALVLPIARKPEFSLEDGYAGPVFIIAFTILMVVVMAFMLCFANLRPRRYVFLGEMIGNLTARREQPYRLMFRTARFQWLKRAVGWLALTLVWSPAVCILFVIFQVPVNFVAIYVFALSLVLVIYLIERRQALLSDLNDANEMWVRYDAARQRISGKGGRK